MDSFILLVGLCWILNSPQEQKKPVTKMDTIRMNAKIELIKDSIFIEKQQKQIIRLDSIIKLKKKKL